VQKKKNLKNGQVKGKIKKCFGSKILRILGYLQPTVMSNGNFEVVILFAEEQLVFCIFFFEFENIFSALKICLTNF